MHAYMIIAHNQFEILKRLICALDDPRHDLYIHIDAKVHNFDFAAYKNLAKYSKVVFTDRVSITWGEFSQIQCEMLLLKSALEHENKENPYTYFHLLSGVDLPIKTNDEIYAFFENNAGKEFLHYSDDVDAPAPEDRIRYYHIFRKKRNMFFKILANVFFRVQVLLHVNRLKNMNLRVRKGCNWFSITRALAGYIVANEKMINKVFSYSYCGDEVFIHTLVENSDFKNHLYMPNCNNDHLACVRLIDWQRGNPYVFTIDDYALLKSSPAMFARKFDFEKHPEIVLALTENDCDL